LENMAIAALYVISCTSQRHFVDHPTNSEMGSSNDGYNRRPQLAALLEAAKQRAFDVLVITTHHQFSRRPAQATAIIEELQQYGVQVESVDDHGPDDATSLVQVLTGFAAVFQQNMRAI
jgi:DNA invertase Pin-like site-specific DNA recombinase